MPLYSAVEPLPVNRIKNRLFDPDARDYILRVQSADGQRLESQVQGAINSFIIGCKQDGIWSAIQASCILAGARTLNGALTPLIGTAPTNNGFDSSNYNRKTGLKGNGSKYLSSNFNANSTPQNDHSFGVYIGSPSPLPTATVLIGCGGAETTGGFSQILTQSTGSLISSRNRSATPPSQVSIATQSGFYGSSRNNGDNYNYNYLGNSGTFAVASNEPANEIINVFARRTDAPAATFDRLSFYWIGTSLSLDLFNSRLVSLMSNLSSAIA
jgi:hypothetical protein